MRRPFAAAAAVALTTGLAVAPTASSASTTPPPFSSSVQRIDAELKARQSTAEPSSDPAGTVAGS